MIKAAYNSAEEIPEGLEEIYAESDGKFVLQVEPVDGLALEDVSGLKSALSKERTANSDLKKRLESFKDLDPEEARKAMEKVEEFANFDPDAAAAERIKAREEQMLKKHRAEVEKLTSEFDSLRGQLEQTLIDEAATKAIASEKGSVELLLPHVAKHTRMRRLDDGRYIAEVIDPDGNPRISNAQGSTAPMTIPELVQEMKSSTTFSRAFEGTNSSGGGATGGSTESKSPVRSIRWSDSEAMSANLEDIASGKIQIVD